MPKTTAQNVPTTPNGTKLFINVPARRDICLIEMVPAIAAHTLGTWNIMPVLAAPRDSPLTKKVPAVPVRKTNLTLAKILYAPHAILNGSTTIRPASNARIIKPGVMSRFLVNAKVSSRPEKTDSVWPAPNLISGMKTRNNVSDVPLVSLTTLKASVAPVLLTSLTWPKTKLVYLAIQNGFQAITVVLYVNLALSGMQALRTAPRDVPTL